MSDSEINAVKSDEPTSTFTELHPLGISTGRQSTVDVLQFASQSQPVVVKRMGVGKNLTVEEAEGFLQRLRPYRWALRRAGWNVPKLFQTRIDLLNGEATILSYEEFVSGGDGQYASESAAIPNYRKWFTIRSAVEVLANYDKHLLNRRMVMGKQVTLLPHGLDLKLANLVLSEADNRLYFIDLFGPKELRSDGQWLSYNVKLDSVPPEELIAVTATREGAILRMLRLAESSWVASGSIGSREFRNQIPDLLRESQIPDIECDFISSELENDYPWLRVLYREDQI